MWDSTKQKASFHHCLTSVWEQDSVKLCSQGPHHKLEVTKSSPKPIYTVPCSHFPPSLSPVLPPSPAGPLSPLCVPGAENRYQAGLTQHHSTFGRDLAEMSLSRRCRGSKKAKEATSGLEVLGLILLPLKLVRVKPEDISGYHIRLQHVQLTEIIPWYGKIFIYAHLPFKQDSSLPTSCQSSCSNRLLTCYQCCVWFSLGSSC